MTHPGNWVRRTLVAIAVASAMGGVPAAQVAVLASTPDGVPTGTRAETAAQVRNDRETRVLSLGPTGSLELKTVSGSITVSAGSDKDVHLEIVRESRARSEEAAQAGLDAVKAIVDHQGERATVSVDYPRGRNEFNVSVSYIVSAPAGTRVSATSVSGNVSVREIKGDVSAVSISGSASVTATGANTTAKSISGGVSATDVTGTGTLTTSSVSGNVVIDRATARRVDANTISGTITARSVTADQVSAQSISGTVDFGGAVARGGRYELQSHSGDVRIVAAGGVGFELRASTFSGQIRTGPELVLKDVSQTNRSMRATVGDGSAVVSATTFSGSVTIGRR